MSFAGFALGAANAANSFTDTMEAQRLRDQKRQEWEWEKQRAAAEMSLLGDATEAKRSGYKNDASRNASELDLRPGLTANTRTRTQQEAIGLERAGARQAQVEDTKDTEAATASSTAKVNQGVADQNLALLPQTLGQQLIENQISLAEAGKKANGALATIVDQGDNTTALSFINNMRKNAPKDTYWANITADAAKVGTIPNPADPNDKLFVAMDANGNQVMAISVAKLRALSNPTKDVVVPHDSTIVGIDGQGKVTPKYTAPSTPGALSGKLPAHAQLIEYYRNNLGFPTDKAVRFASRLNDMSPRNALWEGYKEIVKQSGEPRSETERAQYYAKSRAAVEMAFGKGALDDDPYANPNGSGVKFVEGLDNQIQSLNSTLGLGLPSK